MQRYPHDVIYCNDAEVEVACLEILDVSCHSELRSDEKSRHQNTLALRAAVYAGGSRGIMGGIGGIGVRTRGIEFALAMLGSVAILDNGIHNVT